MLWLKSCPRCVTGDMTLDEGGDKLCLQCGFVKYSASGVGGSRRAVPADAELPRLNGMDVEHTLDLALMAL